MHRAIPVSNKILSKRWEENNHRIHEEKLKKMQARVNSGQPVQFAHLKFKAKRDQMLEDRFTEIERENRILLEKMSSIMKKKQNKDSGVPIKSLNKVARKEQMRRITMDNQALLRRLQEKSPCYNTHQWEEERRKTEKRLRSLCEYPYALGRGMSTPTSQKRPRKLSPINRNAVYKKGIAIGVKHFVVEIQKNKKNLEIFMNDVESPDSYSLKLPIKEAQELIGNSLNYDKLVGMLEMDNGEIVLVDPREREERSLESAPVKQQNPRYEAANIKPKTHDVGAAKSYDFDNNDGKQMQKGIPEKNLDPEDYENEENEEFEEQDDEDYEEKQEDNLAGSKSLEGNGESEEENYENDREESEKTEDYQEESSGEERNEHEKLEKHESKEKVSQDIKESSEDLNVKEQTDEICVEQDTLYENDNQNPPPLEHENESKAEELQAASEKNESNADELKAESDENESNADELQAASEENEESLDSKLVEASDNEPNAGENNDLLHKIPTPKDFSSSPEENSKLARQVPLIPADSISADEVSDHSAAEEIPED